MELDDPYFHPVREVRRFHRFQTWLAALIAIALIAGFSGGAAGYTYMLMMDAGMEPGFLVTVGKVTGGILGAMALAFVWVFVQITSFGRWLQRYCLVALREYTRL